MRRREREREREREWSSIPVSLFFFLIVTVMPPGLYLITHKQKNTKLMD